MLLCALEGLGQSGRFLWGAVGSVWKMKRGRKGVIVRIEREEDGDRKRREMGE